MGRGRFNKVLFSDFRYKSRNRRESRLTRRDASRWDDDRPLGVFSTFRSVPVPVPACLTSESLITAAITLSSEWPSLSPRRASETSVGAPRR